MSANTGRLGRDLKRAASLVAAFGRSAGSDVNKGLSLVGAGLADMGRGLGGLGTVAVRATTRAVSLAGKAGANVLRTEAADYFRAAAMISVEVASSAYGRLGAMIGRAIARGSGPALAAANKTASLLGEYYLAPLQKNARTTLDALAYTFGGLGKVVGRAIVQRSGPLIAAVSAIRERLSPLMKMGASIAGRIKIPDISPLFQGMGGGIMGMARGLDAMAIGASKVAAGFFRIGGGLAKIVGAGALRALSGGFRLLSGMAGIAGKVIGGVVHTLLSLPTLIAGSVLAALFVSAAKGAMDLFEQVNRGKIIFGQYADSVMSMSDRMATAFGTSKREFVAGAASFADIFRDAKYSEKDVAALSIHFNKLAIDMSSFYDIPIADSLEKLHSGLAGNVKPLRDLGMSVYDETVNEYAYAHGIAKVGAELTSQQKIQARAILINEKSAKAQGDMARTANSAANMTRSIAGRFENLKESIGTTLVGLLLPVFDDINAGLHAMQMAWDSSKFAADQATRDAIGGSNKQAKGIGFVQRIIMSAADAWRSFKIGALNAIIEINKSILKLMDSLRQTAYMLLETGLQKGRTGFSRADYEKGVEAIQDMNRGLIKQRDLAEKSALPSVSIADMFAKARAEIEKMRTGLEMEPPIDPSKLKPETGPIKAAEPKFASAALAGSQEAASAILKAQFGGKAATKQPEQETARNTRRMADVLDRIALGRNREPIEIKGLPSGQLAATGFLGAFF